MPEAAVAERTLPHNLEAERSVLGAVLLHNDAFNLAAEVIDSNDFFRDAHRRIFDKMITLAKRADAIDLVTLKEELGRSAELEEVGGSAYIAVVIGFAAQRFLMDIVAGALIAFERWYAVGDFIMVEPSKAAGIVEQFGLRTTVLRAFNGDRAYIPNSQIITAFLSPRGYRRYSIELLTTAPEEVEHAIEEVGRRGPAGQARFLRPPRVVETRELEGGAWLVRGVVDVAPTMEWLAEDLLVGALKAQLRSEVLLADPIVYTLDEGTLSRYERRLLIK